MASIVILAGTPLRGARLAASRGYAPADALVATRPADLRNVSGLPVLFDESAWDSKYADAFADYFANEAHLGPVNR